MTNILHVAYINVAAVGSGIYLLIIVAKPGSGLWTSAGSAAALPYSIFSFSINVIVTSLIIIRLAMHRRRVNRTLGSGHARPYMSLITMIVESATPYTVSTIIYLILYVINSPLQQLITSILGSAQVTNNLYDALRVTLMTLNYRL